MNPNLVSEGGDTMDKIKRKDVVAVAESDSEYGHCGTCKHYQHLVTCGNCYGGSRYCFDWREYAKENAEKFVG